MTEQTEVDTASANNGEGNNQNNNTNEETELDSAIIRQVEYYFGDLNLPRDKFLHDQVKLDDGWVPLDILIKFNRLAKLTTDREVIVNALNKSTSGLLEISNDKNKVRRSPEFPIPEMNEERRKEIMSRTIYAKGFPKDSVVDDLLNYFKEFEQVENIFMRKYVESKTKKRFFKGSVFATFKTKEQAEKFINHKGLKHGETELIVKWQEDYLKEKQEEFAARKEKKNKDAENKKVEEKEEFKLPTGTVFQFTTDNDKISREHVKGALTAIGGEVAFIDFKLGDKEGWVRLTKENAAKELFEKMTDGKLQINDSEVKFKILEGDEEKSYLDKSIEEIAKRRKNQKNNRFNKGKNNKGKQWRKRKQDASEDAPPPKIKADDS